MITDEQAKEYAIKLAEYCRGKTLDECCNNNCSLIKVCGKMMTIEYWLDLLKAGDQE